MRAYDKSGPNNIGTNVNFVYMLDGSSNTKIKSNSLTFRYEDKPVFNARLGRSIDDIADKVIWRIDIKPVFTDSSQQSVSSITTDYRVISGTSFNAVCSLTANDAVVSGKTGVGDTSVIVPFAFEEE